MAIDWDNLLLGPTMGIFGQQVIYTPAGYPPVTIADAVFDHESAEIQLGEDGQQSIQRKPVLGIRMSWLPVCPAQNDTVQISSTGCRYVVREAIPDGHGHARLTLMGPI